VFTDHGGRAVPEILADYIFDLAFAKGRSAGSIVIASGTANCWPGATLTDTPGKRCGG
jgi:hypothetical protein